MWEREKDTLNLRKFQCTKFIFIFQIFIWYSFSKHKLLSNTTWSPAILALIGERGTCTKIHENISSTSTRFSARREILIKTNSRACSCSCFAAQFRNLATPQLLQALLLHSKLRTTAGKCFNKPRNFSSEGTRFPRRTTVKGKARSCRWSICVRNGRKI